MVTAATNTDAAASPAHPTGTQALQRYPKLRGLITYLESLTGRADLSSLERHLRNTTVTREDLGDICVFGTGGYRRNVIARSAHYELLALCWRSGHCTPIHDHKGSSCAFRVVHGLGTEIRFVHTPSGLICPCATTPMPEGYVCAAEDADIHQVVNMQAPGQDLITLHIYSTPIVKMNTYCFLVSKGAECPAGPQVYDDTQLC